MVGAVSRCAPRRHAYRASGARGTLRGPRVHVVGVHHRATTTSAPSTRSCSCCETCWASTPTKSRRRSARPSTRLPARSSVRRATVTQRLASSTHQRPPAPNSARESELVARLTHAYDTGDVHALVALPDRRRRRGHAAAAGRIPGVGARSSVPRHRRVPRRVHVSPRADSCQRPTGLRCVPSRPREDRATPWVFSPSPSRATASALSRASTMRSSPDSACRAPCSTNRAVGPTTSPQLRCRHP